MKVKLIKNRLSYILGLLLLVAVTLCTLGCGKKTAIDSREKGIETESLQKEVEEEGPVTLGEGEKIFYFSYVDPEGNQGDYIIYTDQQFVGKALQEVGLIEGEEGPYGLYVKTVNGITVDYDTSGMYWAFYEGEEYGMTGVDVTEITVEASYSFKAEK